jgi:ectoine hydroxylase-related dioxygenase (phytanoyl-CoA dioxygenase family)
MVHGIWRLLTDKYGIQPDSPATWTVRQVTGFQSLTRSGTFNSVEGPAVVDALDDLIGKGAWKSTGSWGAPLVTFPEHACAWDVPRGQWHLDFPARGSADRLPGIRALAFIAPVACRGGGTVVLTGSHRLVEQLVRTSQAREGHSAQTRDSLAASHPWLRDLWSEAADQQDRVRRFIDEGVNIDEIRVRVQELTGVTGDVVLMHPWTFHAPAPNCGSTPRLMVSHSVFSSML